MGPANTALVFPCQFPIKVVGHNSPDFVQAVRYILDRHLPQLPDDAIQRRDSKQSHYAALTIDTLIQTREQLDAIYQELSHCEHVLMAI